MMCVLCGMQCGILWFVMRYIMVCNVVYYMVCNAVYIVVCNAICKAVYCGMQYGIYWVYYGM